MEKSIFNKIIAAFDNNINFSLVTVINAFGSTPARVGFRMLVYSNGKSEGSVGGGALEAEATKEALDQISSSKGSYTKDFNLEDELNMACGGKVTLLFESNVKYHLHLVGCGHVAQAIAPVALQANFRVSVYDDREEYMKSAKFPEEVTLIPGDLDETLPQIEGITHNLAVVMTYDHELDEKGVRLLINKGLPYLGLIGSTRKSKKIRGRLLKSDINEQLVDSLRCPIGLPIGGDTPYEIALSVVGELVAFRSGKPFLSWE